MTGVGPRQWEEKKWTQEIQRIFTVKKNKWSEQGKESKFKRFDWFVLKGEESTV